MHQAKHRSDGLARIEEKRAMTATTTTENRIGGAREAIARSQQTRRRVERADAARRRRLLALSGLFGAAFVAMHAGAALGGSSLAAPERGPRPASHIAAHVVEPGETLWEIAGELAPHEDRRAVVDAIEAARGTSAIHPGETITWLAG